MGGWKGGGSNAVPLPSEGAAWASVSFTSDFWGAKRTATSGASLILALIVLITVSWCEVDERRVALKVGGVLKLAKQFSENSQKSF